MVKSKLARSKRRGAFHLGQQRTLFSLQAEPVLFSTDGCEIVSVGKRRDGGTRYWCLFHKADATAKYGKPAKVCRASHIAPIRREDILSLNIDKYLGGIALWGAVPAVYDTTRLPMERGIHVHARPATDSSKEIDCTYRAVRIVSKRLHSDGILVSELDAIYYMVSSVFGYEMRYVTCSYCGEPHLDRDWFSVHPHRRHLCAGCGRHFRDTEASVGNPIAGIRDACGVDKQKPTMSARKIDLSQAEFMGGIQLWGSNPAFLWTSRRPEEEGIHVHAFRDVGEPQPKVDETYGEVVIDGVRLDPVMVRVLMAQSALPSIVSRVMPLDCPSCGHAKLALGESAFTPIVIHTCEECGHEFSARGKLRKVIANPLVRILSLLAKNAPREPQHHDLGLMPETL
jgi:hypothetical protein